MATSRLLIPVLVCLTVGACQNGSKDDERPAAAHSGGAVAKAPADIVGTGTDQTLECGGGPVNVAGHQNTLHLMGSCPTLNIAGWGNRITVDRVTVINLTGHTNTVTWGAGDPHVNNLGRDNTVNHGGAGKTAPASPPSGGPIVIMDDNVRRTIACAGNAVAVQGEGGQLTFTGTCASVSITGDANHVTIASTPRLQVLGSGNSVTSGGNPQVSNLGTDNRITRQ